MLLKDMSLADWNETIGDETTISQVKSPSRSQESEEFFKAKISSAKKESTTPLKQDRTHLRVEKHKGSLLQQSPMGRDLDQIHSNQQIQSLNSVPQISSLRSGVSPTPKMGEVKKKRNFKINDKFE